MRFLLNGKYTVPECAKRFRDMVALRDEHRVDEVMLALQNGLRPQDFEFANEMLAILPERIFTCVDLNNTPCAVQFLGRSDPKKLSNITQDQMTRFCIFRHEYIRLVLDTASAIRNELLLWNSVIHMEGFSAKSFSVSALKMYNAANEPVNIMYKDCCSRLFLTQCGSAMTLMWGTAKKFFPQRTVDKVSVFGSDWKQKLSKFVSSDQIEQGLGGDSDPNLSVNELVRLIAPTRMTKQLSFSQNDL